MCLTANPRPNKRFGATTPSRVLELTTLPLTKPDVYDSLDKVIFRLSYIRVNVFGEIG